MLLGVWTALMSTTVGCACVFYPTAGEMSEMSVGVCGGGTTWCSLHSCWRPQWSSKLSPSRLLSSWGSRCTRSGPPAEAWTSGSWVSLGGRAGLGCHVDQRGACKHPPVPLVSQGPCWLAACGRSSSGLSYSCSGPPAPSAKRSLLCLAPCCSPRTLSLTRSSSSPASLSWTITYGPRSCSTLTVRRTVVKREQGCHARTRAPHHPLPHPTPCSSQPVLVHSAAAGGFAAQQLSVPVTAAPPSGLPLSRPERCRACAASAYTQSSRPAHARWGPPRLDRVRRKRKQVKARSEQVQRWAARSWLLLLGAAIDAHHDRVVPLVRLERDLRHRGGGGGGGASGGVEFRALRAHRLCAPPLAAAGLSESWKVAHAQSKRAQSPRAHRWSKKCVVTQAARPAAVHPYASPACCWQQLPMHHHPRPPRIPTPPQHAPAPWA